MPDLRRGQAIDLAAEGLDGLWQQRGGTIPGRPVESNYGFRVC